MGVFAKPEPKAPATSKSQAYEVDLAVAEAQFAWDGGRRCFIYRQGNSFRADTSNAEIVNAAVDRMLAIGWELHSTALTLHTFGSNHLVAMFTFVRPKR